MSSADILNEIAGQAVSAEVIPNSAGALDSVSALCAHVRAIAQASGEDYLRAKRYEAEALIHDAENRVTAEGATARRRAQERFEKHLARELQKARLATRALLANVRWSELGRVLDEAEREAASLRMNHQTRYAAALVRFFESARNHLPGLRLVVHANSQDSPKLHDYVRTAGQDVEFLEAEIVAGVKVTTSDGNAIYDQTIASRRRRIDHELRMIAADVLFHACDQSHVQGRQDE
jgi:vacuolar-type H+-ATPase subunit E/Vma4